MPKLSGSPEALARVSSLNRKEVGLLAEIFRLLGDTSRLRIALLCAAGPHAVTDLAEKLDMSVSLVSHHLRLLRASRLVPSEPQGRPVIYPAAHHNLRCVLPAMPDHMAQWSTAGQ